MLQILITVYEWFEIWQRIKHENTACNKLWEIMKKKETQKYGKWLCFYILKKCNGVDQFLLMFLYVYVYVSVDFLIKGEQTKILMKKKYKYCCWC